MVYAFLIQTLSPKDCDILFYRFYSCYYVQGNISATKSNGDFEKEINTALRTNCDPDSLKSTNRATKLFETSVERSDFLQLITNKVCMQYSMKLKHSLLPLNNQDSSVRGMFIERKWKQESSVSASIVWQSVGNMAFVLVCKRCENLLQAQNVLDIITTQLETHLQFISNPVVPLTNIETVSLIVNQYLPSGEIMFMNSKLVRAFEKQLEVDLYTH
ncbi:hypothetical protein R5R35_006816 [Gryllus longicercus]|uniref:Uncharacterized protein n=1 Tax=Gryllus longicercus TaxID=2509291 RepID=A0AAN9VQE9_9ORTH